MLYLLLHCAAQKDAAAIPHAPFPFNPPFKPWVKGELYVVCGIRKIKYIRKTLYEIFLRDKEKMLVWLIGNQSKYADRKRVFKDYTQE